jgi:outer membrane autotransporter protein
LAAIAVLPTAAAVADALAQLGPGAASLAAPQLSYQVTQQFQDLWANHLEAQEACSQDSQPNDPNRRRLADSSICQSDDQHPHLWVTGFGYSGSPVNVISQGSVDGFAGYDSRIAGGMLVYDAPLNRSVHVGVGVRYAQTLIDGSAFNARGGGASHDTTSSYQVMAYVGFAPGPWYVNGALTYGLDAYSSDRLVRFPGVSSLLSTKYSGNQTTLFATTGYHLYLNDGRTVVTPYATLQYTSLHTDAYTENGDPALDLAVNAQHYDFLQSGLGGKIARDIPLWGSQDIQPELHARWLYALDGDTMTNTAAFISGGSAFTIQGLSPDRNTYNVGAGIAFGNSARWSIEGAYDYLWRSQNYSAQQLMISFVLRV